MYLRWTNNNLQSAKNRTANAVKPISKPANERFHSYLNNGTIDWLKVTSNVLKIEQQMLQDRFQKRWMNVFARIFATISSND